MIRNEKIIDSPPLGTMLFYSIIVIAFIMFLGVPSCKRNPPVVVTSGIGYPPLEEQDKIVEKLSPLFEKKGAADRPYEVLRQVIEHVPMNCAKRHLEAISKTGSTRAKANAQAFLGCIEKIQAMNEGDASKFVAEMRKDGNVDALAVSVLGLRTESQQAEAAEALASLKSPKAVHVLTEALHMAAGMPEGGSESQYYRKQLRQSLVKALASSTGLEFSDYDASSEATIKAEKSCEEWLQKKN